MAGYIDSRPTSSTHHLKPSLMLPMNSPVAICGSKPSTPTCGAMASVGTISFLPMKMLTLRNRATDEGIDKEVRCKSDAKESDADDDALLIDGHQLPFRGHAKATGDVCKGVITIDPNDTRLGSSNVAVVIFEGKFVPRQIYYNDQGIPVRLYKETIPACHRCDTVGHRVDICPRPKPGRCDQCGSEVATTPEGPVEHKCTPRCLICGGEHLTGTSGCNGKYRKPIKPGTSPTTDKRKEDFKKIQASKGSHKASTPVSGRPAPVKNNTGSGTMARTQIFSAEDFPTLPNAKNEVSDWVRAASRPLSSPFPPHNPNRSSPTATKCGAKAPERNSCEQNSRVRNEASWAHGVPNNSWDFGANAAVRAIRAG
ncbi:hypothetical protein HPB48_016725 [Haemaphysalis longicornis]|uniref:Uncharacterized protein n=1 Tax=Haemaphysalis longicornis TaxID=44386 RepID=A0A9J6G0W1_HAELO|nr:hypothetical protein HPB48_016725 [Haemaphysalis longicornis]